MGSAVCDGDVARGGRTVETGNGPWRRVETDFAGSARSAPAVILYNLKVDEEKGILHVQRRMDMQILLLEVKYYPALRNFFQTVRSADDQQIVLQQGAAAASN